MRSARAEVSCTRGVREVVDVWVEVNLMVAAGRALLGARVCARRRSRDEVLGDGSARAYLVVEAASPIGTCSFLVCSFRKVKRLQRTLARAGWALGYGECRDKGTG